MSKVCNTCKEEKALTEYYADKRVKLGVNSYCKACCQERGKRIYHQNKERFKDWRLQRVYGITLQQYQHLLAGQQGACAICKASLETLKKGIPVIDHCHETGVIRGVLCQQCNSMLGMARDNAEVLIAAAAYIQKS